MAMRYKKLTILVLLLCLCLLLTACVKKKASGNTANPSYIDSNEDLDPGEHVDTNEDLEPSVPQTTFYDDSGEDMN